MNAPVVRFVVAALCASVAWTPFAVNAEAEQIVLKTADGSTTASLVAKCSSLPFLGCVIGHREDKKVTFILPAGYRRTRFSSEEFNKDGHSGGYARWANDDPHDATILIHAWADAFSKIEIVVKNVIAEKE